MQRFSDGVVMNQGDIPGCGGEIDIAVITHREGFRWLQRKELEARGSERLISTKSKDYGDLMGKVGRNDPCPCGSGKKYKKCCGDNRKSNRINSIDEYSLDQRTSIMYNAMGDIFVLTKQKNGKI